MQDFLYFDYAATTPICSEAKQAILECFDIFANPSSMHLYGRKSRVVIENSRNCLSDLLQCSPDSLTFTSGATEAINLGLDSICQQFNPKSLISSPLEHAATLKSLNFLSQKNHIPLHYVKHNHKGILDLNHLENLLIQNPQAVVCLMHANNEIGNLLPIKEVGKLCSKYQALFFCDMVQSIGKYPINLSDLPIDFAVCSAHKFYGSKGCGLLYHRHNIKPLLLGGHQERNLRAGTENIATIAAMSAALKMSMSVYEQEKIRIENLKYFFIQELKEKITETQFVGTCQNGGLYNLINLYFPNIDTDILFMRLDMAGIAVSFGSACSSGNIEQSHVLQSLEIPQKSLRITFGILTQQNDVQKLIDTIFNIYTEIS